MSFKEHLSLMVKEAELYRAQGLFQHSKEKYLEVLGFIGEKQRKCNSNKLLHAIKNRIKSVDEDLAANDLDMEAPKLSHEAQTQIKELFSVSQSKEAAKLEGAVALAEFGQYESALVEFHALLKEGTLPVVAAKNILRCYLYLSSPDAAIAQFRQWASADLLSLQELKLIRNFLLDLLKKEGYNRAVPPLVEISSVNDGGGKKEEDVLEISSVILQVGNGGGKADRVEFSVTFQSDNIIRITIPAERSDLVEALTPGLRLPEMQCYSPIAVFRGSGFVSGKTMIRHGPKQGDYILDITMDGI